MREIPTTSVQVKVSDGCEQESVLVHDGVQVIELIAPGGGIVGTHPANTMLAGTEAELLAEISRLNLLPKQTPGAA